MTARSNRAAELAARAAAVAAGPVESADADVRTAPPAATGRVRAKKAGPEPATAPRTKPVRVTVEVSPIEHRTLRRLCARYAEDLDLTEVAGAEVFRALLTLADADPQIAARVGQEIRRTGGTRRR